jgi:hypothetical protein
VFFGTGPAMIKGNSGCWESYPIYHHSLFEKIKETYDIIPELFTKDIETEFIDFLKTQYKTDDLWSPLRKNFKTLPQFTRAFHEKADGLRILQFLKAKNSEAGISDERALKGNLEAFVMSDKLRVTGDELQVISDRLQVTSDGLQELRDLLFEMEMGLRRNV